MAENILERAEHFHDGIRCAGIIDGLGIAAGLDQLLGAKLGEVLRQRRLAQANLRGENANRHLTLNQAAQDHQSLRIGHGREQA